MGDPGPGARTARGGFRGGPSGPAPRLAPSFLLAVVLLSTGCPGGPEPASPAADEYIAAAESEEERQALVEARDEIDAEMSGLAARKDAEIERLRRENEELRKKLAAGGR